MILLKTLLLWLWKALGVILIILNSIIFLGSVVHLCCRYVGCLGYLLSFFVAPFLVPVVFFLPWFDAWVEKEPVNFNVFVMWVALMVHWLCSVIAVLTNYLIEKWRFR